MKPSRMKLMLLSAVTCALSFCLPMIVSAQDDRKPESPRTESPRSENPRSDPAPAQRNDPPPSPPSSGGSSNNDNNSSRNNDSGSRNTDNDSGRRNRDDNGNARRNDNSPPRRANTNPPSGNDGSYTRGRGTREVDGRSDRRDRTVETQDGEVITPRRISGGGTPGDIPGGNRPGGNTNNGNRTGGNPGGGRDRDRDRGGDRHRDGHGHRHRHTDDCYCAPTYDDTIVYSQSNYPDYDDSQSAYEIGYQDGVFTGANDGRRRQTYDPERSHFYREAKRGYRSGKGSRDIYQQAYRDGFLHGYREGYEHWQDHFFGGVFRP